MASRLAGKIPLCYNIFKTKRKRRMKKMKSKTMKLLLSLTRVLCVALALPGLSAGADYVNSFEAGTDIGSIQVFSSNFVI